MICFSTPGAAVSVLLALASAASAAGAGPVTRPPSREKYRDFAMVHQGDANAGMLLFLDEQRLACTRCHTTDGKGGKAGPDLFAIGDKYGRDDLIEQIIYPSKTIAVGYSTTIIRTKAGESFEGIVKEADEQSVGLMGQMGSSFAFAMPTSNGSERLMSRSCPTACNPL